VDTVADVVATLPPAERQGACIVTNNYGEASALLLLGQGRGLPPVISGHNNFWLWGPGSCTGRVLITVNLPTEALRRGYASVVRAATSHCQYCMAEENDIPIDICTRPTVPFARVWSALRHFN
jgi:hypothetical protein